MERRGEVFIGTASQGVMRRVLLILFVLDGWRFVLLGHVVAQSQMKGSWWRACEW